MEKILHGGGADVAVGKSFGEIGGEAELCGGDAPANDGSADGKEAGLLLRLHAEMIAMDLRGKIFRLGGIERVTEAFLDGGEEGIGSPAVFEEKVFEAGALPALAEDFAGTEDFGDGADNRNDLVLTDEGVEADGEMRLGGKAASYAEGEAEGRSGEWPSCAEASAGRQVAHESEDEERRRVAVRAMSLISG